MENVLDTGNLIKRINRKLRATGTRLAVTCEGPRRRNLGHYIIVRDENGWTGSPSTLKTLRTHVRLLALAKELGCLAPHDLVPYSLIQEDDETLKQS